MSEQRQQIRERKNVVDAYLRREDTFLAQALLKISGTRGEPYRKSATKEAFELTVALPAALLSIPAIAVLGAVIKAEDGGKIFFYNNRVRSDGEPMQVTKLRTLRENSHVGPQPFRELASLEPENDPRATRVGKVLRRFNLEELPQLLSVLQRGNDHLSLVGIRSATPESISYLHESRPMDFPAWSKAYNEGVPGLFHLSAAVNKRPKDVVRQMKYDILYAKNASLGLDLYILFKASLRLIKKLKH